MPHHLGSGGDLFFGEPMGLLCLGPSGTPENPQESLRKHRTPQSVCVWSGVSETHCHRFKRWLDPDCQPNMQGRGSTLSDHLQRGLAGKVFDPNVGGQVWRTSLAAEYPAGLCWAWASALRTWLVSDDGVKTMASRTLIKTGKFNNILVRLDHCMKGTDTQAQVRAQGQGDKGGMPAEGERNSHRGSPRSQASCC